MALPSPQSTATRPPRVALFGGSFDPPHCGHLAIAQAASGALSLDRVLFAPVARQPLKTDLQQIARFHHRVAMTQLAIAGHPNFELSLLDAPTEQHRPNYTVETLERLRFELPSDTELFFLIGADSLQQFPRWHRAEEIPFLASLIVASRPGESEFALATPQSWLPLPLTPKPNSPRRMDASSPCRSIRIAHSDGRAASIYFLDDLHFDISATRLRQSLARTMEPFPSVSSMQNLLPKPVLAYILEHNLYRDAPNPND